MPYLWSSIFICTTIDIGGEPSAANNLFDGLGTLFSVFTNRLFSLFGMMKSMVGVQVFQQHISHHLDATWWVIAVIALRFYCMLFVSIPDNFHDDSCNVSSKFMWQKSKYRNFICLISSFFFFKYLFLFTLNISFHFEVYIKEKILEQVSQQ